MIKQKLSTNEIFKKNKNQIALVSSELSYSYVEFKRLIATIQANLIDKKIGKGEKVAILSENTKYFPAIILGLIFNGIVAVPLNTRFPNEQLLSLFKKINCTKVIVEKKYRSSLKNSDLDLIRLEELINKIKYSDSAIEKNIEMNQEATIIFTSGSSGQPKAALHTFENHYYNAIGSNLNLPLKSGDRWLAALPLYHVGGLAIIFRTLFSGAATVIPDYNLSMLQLINRFNVTHISLVSTQLFRLLQDKRSIKILRNMKAILLGGSFLPSALIKKCIEYNLPIYTTYGSTEMSSQVTTTKPNESSKNLFTSGTILENREIKLSDDGEILVKGQTLFKGYVEEKGIDLKIDKDGWFKTGDVGNINKNGYLSVLGRKDNMFVSGGENIFPEEIEKILNELPQVSNTIVVDIPDEEYGARPFAFICVKNSEKFDPKPFSNYLKKKLPGFKIPIEYFDWKNDERSFKPNRKKLRQIALKEYSVK